MILAYREDLGDDCTTSTHSRLPFLGRRWKSIYDKIDSKNEATNYELAIEILGRVRIHLENNFISGHVINPARSAEIRSSLVQVRNLANEAETQLLRHNYLHRPRLVI